MGAPGFRIFAVDDDRREATELDHHEAQCEEAALDEQVRVDAAIVEADLRQAIDVDGNVERLGDVGPRVLAEQGVHCLEDRMT